MTAASIVALRPNVTQAEAIREFSKIGISSVAWRVRAGVLQRIANAYVPYQFYEVSYTMARAPHTRLFYTYVNWPAVPEGNDTVTDPPGTLHG